MKLYHFNVIGTECEGFISIWASDLANAYKHLQPTLDQMGAVGVIRIEE